MSKIDEVARKQWVIKMFSEQDIWLNKKVEAEQAPDNIVMWWPGSTDVRTKPSSGGSIPAGLWCSNVKHTKSEASRNISYRHYFAI